MTDVIRSGATWAGSEYSLREDTMCNDYRLLTDAAALVADFSESKIKIRFSEGSPTSRPERTSKLRTRLRSCARSRASRRPATGLWPLPYPCFPIRRTKEEAEGQLMTIPDVGISGTTIHEYAEECATATDALDRVRTMMASGPTKHPNLERGQPALLSRRTQGVGGARKRGG